MKEWALVEDEVQFIESIQFNDFDKSLKVLESIKDDLAGIIVEPILGGAGCITPARRLFRRITRFCKEK